MRKIFKTSFVVILALLLIGVFAVSVFAQESNNNKRVRARLVKPINVSQQTNDSEAAVAEVNQAGISVGLNNMHLIGRNSFVKKESGDTGVSIEWHSISLTSGTENVSEPLSKSMASKFTTTDPKVETGQQVTVYGDWDELLKDLTALKKKQEEKVTKVEDVEEDKKESSGLEPVGATSSTVPASSNNPYSDMNTDVQTTTYEDCPPFFNEGANVVEEQKKKIVTGESGTNYETGLCTSTGVIYPIKTKDGDCGFQWDLESMVVTKMVQRYYELNGEPVDVGECWASNSTYPITEFTDGCEVQINEANMVALPQSRLGFEYPDSGIREYYNECTPQGTEEWPLYNDNCTDDEGAQSYEHDFTNHFSYAMVRKYYLDPEDGSQVFANECSRSTTLSYEHKYETDTCGWVMDDEALQGQQFSYTYIETPEGNATIQDCSARTSPVAYAYVGLEDNVTEFFSQDYFDKATGQVVEVIQSFTPPAGVTRIKVVLMVGGGEHGGHENPGTKGGDAGEVLENRTLTILDGETIPVHVGSGGPGYMDWNKQYGPGTDSDVGNEDSSFVPLKARMGGGVIGGYGSWSGSCYHAATPGPGGPGFQYNGSLYGGGGNGMSKNADSYVCGKLVGWQPGKNGIVVLGTTVQRYLRPDGAYYDLPYNGD